MNIKDIQTALKEKGFNPGPVDGILGALTRKAVRNFQAANGLVADGIVGPKTRSKLTNSVVKRASNEIPLDMPWLIEAARLITTREIVGPEHNPVIMNWAKDLNVGYASDEVAWCGLFVGHCVGSQLPEEGLPDNILGAQRWRKFGREVKPQFGSVLVFWRGKPSSWKGHVGFYWAEDKTHYHVLGGNQSNAVNVKRLPKKRFLAARWPKSVAEGGIIRTASSKGVLISDGEA
jgi:uncharacterized protein (TIGR02594 family)